MEQAQLAPIECSVQRGLHREAVGDPFVHRFVVERHAVPAGVLGSVHRRVGVAQHVLRPGPERW